MSKINHECPICFNLFADDTSIAICTRCKNEFCDKCIDDYSYYNNTLPCPLCNNTPGSYIQTTYNIYSYIRSSQPSSPSNKTDDSGDQDEPDEPDITDNLEENNNNESNYSYPVVIKNTKTSFCKKLFIKCYMKLVS